MENTTTEPDFKAVIDGLLAGQENEAISFYRANTSGKVDERCLKDPEYFYYQLQYPYEQFLKGLIAGGVPDAADKSRLSFLLRHSQFVDAHFEKLFESFEGSSGCCDKSRFCVSALMRFFQTGQAIVLNYDQ